MTTEPTPELDRRSAWVLAVVSATGLVVLAVWLVPWDWVPSGSLDPAAASDLFSRAEIARAEEFASTRRILGWSSFGVSLGLALVLGLTRWGARLVRLVAGRMPWWGVVLVGSLTLLLAGRIATLPFALAIRERNLAYDLTRQGIGGWTADQVKGLLVGWVLTALVLLVIVGAARRRPRTWPLHAGAAVAALVLLGSFLYPVVIEPVFNRFTSLPSGSLRAEVLALADRQDVAIDDVLVSDASRRTTTFNAYVSGIGSTRRVVVYDTMLVQMEPGEVAVVVAHELAHAKHNDVLVGTALGAAGGLLGISLLALVLDSSWLRRKADVRGATDPAAAALILALSGLATFVTSPAVNAVSRAVEARADREALEATGKPTAFVNVQRQLALRSLQDPTPPALSQFWFGSHPTVLERAGLPESLAEADR